MTATKVKNKKEVKNQLTQTEVVKELTKRYPKMTPKEIQEQTGIKIGTIYAIQSRMRKQDKNNKHKAHKVAHTEHMDKVASIDMTTPTSEENAKVALFNRITDTYLSKIAEAKNFSEAEKYNKLLIEMLQSI